jgi:protein-S-isoprenylcysteine O-methyltransferase Ste14
MTNHRYYPKILVFLQFALIALMVVLSSGIFENLFALFIFLVGAVLGLWALNHNKVGNFNIQPKMKEDAKLITSGIYAYVRHPMYSSVLTMMLGVLLSTPTVIEMILFILLIVVLLLKAKKEESIWLQASEEYAQYKNGTKFFVPFVL